MLGSESPGSLQLPMSLSIRVCAFVAVKNLHNIVVCISCEGIVIVDPAGLVIGCLIWTREPSFLVATISSQARIAGEYDYFCSESIVASKFAGK